MQVKHVAWFAAGLAIYDSMFTLVWPVSNLLIRSFVNHPLFPAMGMRIHYDEAIVGLGDLLVYAGFTIAAYKAYGRKGLRLAIGLVLVFGAVMPTLSGLLLNYVDARLDVGIPAQTCVAATVASAPCRSTWPARMPVRNSSRRRRSRNSRRSIPSR
jgi:hypothetical protein